MRLSELTTAVIGSYKCDISINSEGLRGVSVIAEYLHSMPALRYIVFVVKNYLARIKLGSPATAGLGSYSTILLIINYLQVRLHAFTRYDHPTMLPYSSIPRASRKMTSQSLLRKNHWVDCSWASSNIMASTSTT